MLGLGPLRRAHGQPKKTWLEVTRIDMETKEINEDLARERYTWGSLIAAHDTA